MVRPARDLRPCRQQGFTLLELLVVLAIIAMVTAVALPSLSHRRGPDAATAARDIAAALMATRAHAMATRRPAVFTVDLADGRFHVPGGRDGALPAGLGLTLVTSAGQAAGHVGAITFYPDGGATGGRLRLTGRGHDADIEVDWLTGAVRHAP